MRGQQALSSNGIKSEIKRNAGKGSKLGCGYVLAVSESNRTAAEDILRKNGIKILPQ